MNAYLDLEERLGRPEGQGLQLGNLGLCHKALGDVGTARDYLGRAVAIYNEVRSPEARKEAQEFSAALATLA